MFAFYAFAGVEVKNGTPLHIDPGVDMLVHISQVLLNSKLDLIYNKEFYSDVWFIFC